MGIHFSEQRIIEETPQIQSRHNGTEGFKGPLISQHYGTEGFKGLPQLGPHYSEKPEPLVQNFATESN